MRCVPKNTFNDVNLRAEVGCGWSLSTTRRDGWVCAVNLVGGIVHANCAKEDRIVTF